MLLPKSLQILVQFVSKFNQVFFVLVRNNSFVLVQGKFPGGARDVDLDMEEGAVSLSRKSGGLWKEDGQQLKQCWNKPILGKDRFVLNVMVILL